MRTEIALWNAVDDAVSTETPVNLGLLTALRHIDAHDGQARVQEVADGIGITVGAASKIVDRLERAQLVRRRPHPADKRSSLIELTDDGAQALRFGMRAVLAELRRRTDVLTPEDLAATTMQLAALGNAFAPSGCRA